MCLCKNNEATEKFRKNNKNKRKVVVWKLYRIYENGEVYPLYYHLYPVKPGFIKSNRTSIKDEMCNIRSLYNDVLVVNRGIHVFTTRKAARHDWRTWFSGLKTKLFKCEAMVKDLVAVGGDSNSSTSEAVFMKIHISKEEFEKGKKGRN
jgi:hypothetical protein